MTSKSKSDVKVFFLGMLVVFTVEIISNWQDAVRGFNDGFGWSKSK